jgi:lipoprotein-anchoring transpeptidase ErfK/SrfK
MKRVAVSFLRMTLWKRAAFSLLVVLSAAVALAPSAGPPRSVGSGVTIAGMNAAGLDAEQVRQQIRRTFGAPLQFRFGKHLWRVPASRFGAAADVDGTVSRALRAASGQNVDVQVGVDKQLVRAYVAELDKRFGIPVQNARLVGLVNLQPSISQPKWGRAVRRGTMVAAIMRTLHSRIRPAVPVVLKPLKPTVKAATFGSVIVIRRGSNRLDLYDGTRHVRSFPVATGRSQYPTPTGTFSIVDMQRNPWWRPPNSAWAKGLKPIPPGPGNPLGTRWMGTSAPGVGIHGTPDAASVGYSASHGCIRMYIPDADWLFNHVSIGTPVVIVSA